MRIMLNSRAIYFDKYLWKKSESDYRSDSWEKVRIRIKIKFLASNIQDFFMLTIYIVKSKSLTGENNATWALKGYNSTRFDQIFLFNNLGA
jgi:hypothetical protein